MNPARFVTLIAALILLAAPPAAEAQPARNKPRIALLSATTKLADLSGPNPKDPGARAFLQGMREHGWVDEENITIERRSAEGHPDRFLAVAQDAVDLRVDVLVVSGWQAYVLAAQQATRTIPIVMVGMGGDAVALGLAKSLSSPGGNVTGSQFSADPATGGKRIQLLKEMAPGISRVSCLHQPGLGAGTAGGSLTESAARALGLTLVWLEVNTSKGITGPLAQVMRNQANALFVQGGHPWLYRRQIIEFAATHRLPAMYAIRGFVEAGGLMSYGANYDDMSRRAASYVSKILKGAKLGDLPIEQPTKQELVINLKTAKALGLTIPQSLLLQADEVIQ